MKLRDQMNAKSSANHTANLQMTTAQAAKQMNVSERLVYMSRELMATGREDLCQAVARGEMTTHAALKTAKPEKYDKPKPTSWDRLVRAWNSATDEDRDRFVFTLMRMTEMTKRSI
jgi:hypothetical protein